MAERTPKKRGSGRLAVVELPPVEGAGEGENERKSEASKAAEEQIEVASEGQNQNAEAIIHRINPATGKEAYLDKVSPEVISQEWLAQEYGGGKYRVQFRKPDPNGSNRLVYGGQTRFEVDESIPMKPPRHARASGAISNADGSPASAPPLSAGMDAVLQSGILSLFTQMQNANQMQLEFMKRMNDDRTAPARGPDLVAILTALTPLLTPIVTGLLERKDPLDLATKLLALRGEAPAQTGGASDVMKTVKDVLEIREMFGGGGGEGSGPDPMLKLIETIAPQLLDTFKQAMALDAARAGQQIPSGAPATASRTASLPPTPAAPAPAASTAAVSDLGRAASEPAPTTGNGETVDAWKLLVGPRIAKIFKLAEADKNPVLYAQLEEDIMPEIYKPAAREFVAEDGFIEKIYTEYPQLLQYKEWFDEFFDVFAAALLGELDDDDETEIVHEEEDRARALSEETPSPPATDNGSIE